METVGVSKLRENMMESARKALEELRKTAFVGDVLSPITEDWEAME